MPNWCDNYLEVNHADKKMMRRFVKGWNRGRLFDEFIPVPPELKDSCLTIEEIQKRHKQNRNMEYEKELGSLTESLNLRFFGYKNWYDYCVQEWGTKWDIGGSLEYGDYLTPDNARRMITVCFNSAWSPPISAYEKLSDMGFSIRAYYFEGGMMFCGSWIDGEDRYFDIKECKSEWVKANIPEDIDDYMGISDGIQLDEECEDV
jgi:hypothetical protein